MGLEEPAQHLVPILRASHEGHILVLGTSCGPITGFQVNRGLTYSWGGSCSRPQKVEESLCLHSAQSNTLIILLYL